MTATQVFSCEICEIYKNTYYEEHLWTVASIILVLDYNHFVSWDETVASIVKNGNWWGFIKFVLHGKDHCNLKT